MTPGKIRVLEADPDLGRGLGEAERRCAETLSWTTTRILAPGPWSPDLHPEATCAGALGLLVLDGLLTRQVAVGGRHSAELLGSGDLLRPWELDTAYGAAVRADASWEVRELTSLAILDRGFAKRMSAWPEVTGELMGRAVGRSRAFAIRVCICQIPN
ncbi:MAG: hypothetical protein ACRDL0_12745, partial [Thermoleophilaceae bacterium]